MSLLSLLTLQKHADALNSLKWHGACWRDEDGEIIGALLHAMCSDQVSTSALARPSS